jgi:hypothetical protein
MDQVMLDIENTRAGWHSPWNLLPSMKKKVLLWVEGNQLIVGYWMIHENEFKWVGLDTVTRWINVSYWRHLPPEPMTMEKISKGL